MPDMKIPAVSVLSAILAEMDQKDPAYAALQSVISMLTGGK